MTTVLVLGAGGAAGVNFCRALRRAHCYSIIATDVHPLRLHLPDADHRLIVPKIADRSPGFVQWLCQSHKAHVVYAQADSEVRALVANPPPGVATLLPSMAALDIAADKLALNKHLDGWRVPVPQSSFAVGPEAKVEFDTLRMLGNGKVWIRAKCGAGSKAALPVTSFDQAQHWIDYWKESRGLRRSDFMQCQFLPGDEFAWQGLYSRGTLLASVCRQRIEYVFAEQMPSGQSSTPSIAKIVHRADVNQLAERAVATLGPMTNGVFGVDCKTDAAGQVRVTEINVGRFYTTSDFYAACGMNLPAIWVEAARGGSFATQRDPIPAGKTWVRSLDREAVLC